MVGVLVGVLNVAPLERHPLVGMSSRGQRVQVYWCELRRQAFATYPL